MSRARRIPLDGCQNLRDLGGYATPEGPVQSGRFLRADGLHHLSAEAQNALSHLALVIDLRHEAETEAAPNPLAAGGVPYRNISLFAGLDPSKFAPEPNCAEDEVLLSLYRQTLRQNGAVFVRILTEMAEAPEGPILFHCTAGKDRTGLVAMMLLSLAGASREDIIADYALTEELIRDLIAEITAKVTAAGKDGPAYARAFLRSNPTTMARCLAFIDQEFGTIEAYLLQNGLTLAALEQLKTRLLRSD